jgi:hypothetical protein
VECEKQKKIKIFFLVCFNETNQLFSEEYPTTNSLERKKARKRREGGCEGNGEKDGEKKMRQE